MQRLGALRSAALVFACVALFVGLRSVNLDADPTRKFGPRATRELVAEPAAKSHEARNYALFGAYHLNDADDYQFWRAQSPIWVYPLTAFFEVFGVDWPQLRLFSTLYASIGLAAVLAIALRFLSVGAVCFIGGLVVFDGVYFHYARAGLLEPAVNTWIAISMLALILAQRRPSWLVLAHWAFVLAFFTKQAALVALPVVALATIRVLWWPEAGAVVRPRVRALVLASAAVLALLAVLYVLNSDYQRAVEHNVNHVLLGSDAPKPMKYTGVSSVFTRIIADGRYEHFLRTVPLTGSLALIVAILAAIEAVRTRRLRYETMVLVGWFACSFAAMLAVAWSALRFWTLVVLPSALLAGFALDAFVRFAGQKEHPRFARILAAVGVLASVSLAAPQARFLYEPLFAPRYSLRDGARAIVQAIGPRDATVIGARSPPMVLGTPYKNYYVRAGFNSSREQLKQLAPTHFLFLSRPDGSRGIVNRELPEFADSMTRILEVSVRGDKLRLWAVAEALAGQPRDPAAPAAH